MTPNTFSVQFIIKQDKRDNGGLVPVYAKVFINGSKIELSTFQKINPKNEIRASLIATIFCLFFAKEIIGMISSYNFIIFSSTCTPSPTTLKR